MSEIEAKVKEIIVDKLGVITIPDDKAEKISTVADAIAFIEANK